MKYLLKSSVSLTIFLLVILQLSAHAGRFNSKIEKRPNLLIIHTDEQSFRGLSCYDNSWPEIQTPNIDSLAGMGARCEKFYANHPVCTPSRAALLTGKYAQKGEIYMNDIPLKLDIPTLGDILKQHQYVTGYSGKLHMAGGPYPGLNLERDFGFDDNRYMFNNAHMKMLIINDTTGLLESPGGIGDEESFTTDFLTNRTLEFVRENKDNDWCYMISIPDPHDPNTERSPYDSLFSPEEMSIPATFQLPEGTSTCWPASFNNNTELPDEDFLRQHKALYCGMIKHIDDCVGRIISELESNGLMENTIIVFTTDHGDMMGEFSRLNKGIFHEASAKIPFIMYYPQKIQTNTVVHDLISTIDFVPTMLDLMDIPYATEDFDGKSAAALLTGQGDNDWINTAFLSMPSDLAVITDSNKLIIRKGQKPWLFNLVADPDELINFFDSADYQETIRSLALQLKDYLESHDDPNWTDSLTWYYYQRWYQHVEFRPPEIQNAKQHEVYWKDELLSQMTDLLKEPVRVTDISVSPDSISLSVRDTYQLSTLLSPSNAVNQAVIWSSSDTAIVKINSGGEITGIAEGTATITATTVDGGYTDTCAITVIFAYCTGLSLSPDSVYFYIGQTKQLAAGISPSNASNQNVSWSSSDTNIARVNANGKLTAISAGSAIITATTSDGGYTDKNSVTVLDGTTCPTFKRIEAEDFNDMSGILAGSASDIPYGVKVLTTDGDWCRYNNIDITCAFNIGARVACGSPGGSIEVRLDSISGSLIGTLAVENTGGWQEWMTADYTMISSLTGIYDVYLVFKGGTGNLINLNWLEFAINRTDVTGISLSPASASMLTGDTLQLIASLIPSGANNQDVKWSSSNANVATVKANGEVIARGAGSVTISVTSAEGGFSDESAITVTDIPLGLDQVIINSETYSLTNCTGAVVEIYNTIGTLLSRNVVHDDDYRLEMNGLSSGIYIVRISNTGTVSTQKVFK